MATIDFNLLRSEGPQNLYEGFLQGQKAVAAEQERNMLRQSQMQQMEAQRENILAQREQRLAQASQQQSAEAGRRRRQEVLGRLSSSFEANGLTLDRKTLGEMYKAGLELGDNNLITTATTGLKALDDEDRDKAEMARFGLGPAPAAPAAPPPANAFAVPSLAEGAAAPAPVNAMVDRGRVQQMIMSPSPRVRQMGQALAGTLEKPEASPADVRAYEYARNQGYTGSFMDFKAAQRPPGTKVDVTVSTGRKYGETFGARVAEGDVAMLDAARQAPTLASDANRILDLANNPNVFTGSLAQVKLNVARALGVAGADTNEVVANTEQLIAAAGQSTLNAIKGAGLGTGQGFTDKDLAFLRDIAGGKITFTKETLSELARLQYKVAEKAAGAWGARVKEIPKEALEGTGISTAPITLPPLSRPGGPPKAVGQIPGQAPAAKTVVRTGTLNGRKVVQYSDGTTGYAD